MKHIKIWNMKSYKICEGESVKTEQLVYHHDPCLAGIWHILNIDYSCICVFVHLCICVFMYLFICVVVYVCIIMTHVFLVFLLLSYIGQRLGGIWHFPNIDNLRHWDCLKLRLLIVNTFYARLFYLFSSLIHM